MIKFVRVLVGIAALASMRPIAAAQDQHPAQQEKPKRTEDQFFSGNVVELTPERCTVSRRTLSLTTVTKTFLIDSNTVIEGKLHPKARVTVKFEKNDAGDRAVRILVR